LERKGFYFSIDFDNLLQIYPNISVENKLFFHAALNIAIQTRYDWVDCLLLAEYQINGVHILSIDTDVMKGMKIYKSKSRSNTGSIGKITLGD